MGKGDLGKYIQGGVVVHLISFEDAAVAVAGVLAKTHIGNDGKLGPGVLDRPHGLLDGAVFRVRLRAALIFFLRQAEQQDAWYIEFHH